MSALPLKQYKQQTYRTDSQCFIWRFRPWFKYQYETSAKPLLQFVFLKYSLYLYRMKRMIRFLRSLIGNWKLKESLLSVVPLLMPTLRILPVAPAEVRAMRSLRIEKRMRTWRLRRKPCSKKLSSLT